MASEQPGEPVAAAGVVLCGGASRRMGRPKAWLPWQGEPLVARVVRLVGQAVQPVFVVAAAEQLLPPSLAATVVRDLRPDSGPLEGLIQGLRAARPHAACAFVSACDAALLQPALVTHLVRLAASRQVVMPCVAGRRHPLCAVYATELVDWLEARWAAGNRRLLDLPDALDTRWVTESELRQWDPQLDSLTPMNTPAEYQQALARSAAQDRTP